MPGWDVDDAEEKESRLGYEDALIKAARLASLVTGYSGVENAQVEKGCKLLAQAVAELGY